MPLHETEAWDEYEAQQYILNGGECRWFLLCQNPATQTRLHSVLGKVPICERCSEKIAKLDRGELMMPPEEVMGSIRKHMSKEAYNVLCGLVHPTDVIDSEFITADKEVWEELYKLFPAEEYKGPRNEEEFANANQ